MQKTVTVTEAAQRLGVSRSKIWSLLREGVLEAERNPLDKRQKLIPVASLQKLQDHAQADASGGRPTDALRSVGAGSNPNVRSDELEAYLREHWRPA
jgi:excisionase family DNA binding protein